MPGGLTYKCMICPPLLLKDTTQLITQLFLVSENGHESTQDFSDHVTEIHEIPDFFMFRIE